MTEERDNDPRMERAIRYVDGDMDAAEKAAFESELTTDPLLREDLEAARKTIAGLRSLGEEKLRAELRDADAELHLPQGLRREDGGSFANSRDPEVSGQKRVVTQGPEHASAKRFGSQGAETLRERSSTTKWWLAAAAVILLAGFAWWLLPGETPQQLADEFEISEPGLPVLMGTSPRAMDAIMNAYKQEDYATAGQLLELALTRDPGNDTLRYFNGVVLERTEGCDKSIAEFERVPTGSIFEARALYRSALCALGMGDVQRTRALLQQVMASKDDQLARKAGELLARLDRL